MSRLLWGLLDSGFILLESLIYYYFLSKEMKWKKMPYARCLIIIACFPVTLGVLNFLKITPSAKMVVLLILGIFLNTIFFDAALRKIVILNVLWGFVIVASDGIVMGIVMSVNRVDNLSTVLQRSHIRIQSAVFSKILSFSLLMLVTKMKCYIKTRSKYTTMEMLLITFQGITSMLCLFMIGEFTLYQISTYKITSLFLLILTLFVLISYFVSFFTFDRYFESRKREKELARMESCESKKYQYYQDMEKNQEAVRKMYHDMKNHLLVLNSLMDQQDSSKANLYIEDVVQSIDGIEDFYNTGNTILDIILNESIRKSKQIGIRWEVIIAKDSLLRLDDVDICTIFTNAIDNAIEACEKLQSKPWIKIRAERVNQDTFILFENNLQKVPEKKGNRYPTHKENKAEHGIGLSSIENAVSKYSGIVTIKVEKQVFKLLIMIPT